MKIKILLLISFAISLCYSQNFMNIIKGSGTSSYSVDSIQKITFTDSSMTLVGAAGSVHQIADITKILFTDSPITGVISFSKPTARNQKIVKVMGRTVQVNTSARSLVSIKIYSLSGRQIVSAEKIGRSIKLSNSFVPGVYSVRLDVDGVAYNDRIFIR
jgi:hypothetical protein